MSTNDWLEGLPKLPKLSAGAHEASSREMCAMELVAFMERLPHSDHPPCTCPVLASYVRALNDQMPDARRQELLPLLSRLVDTVNPSLKKKRAEYFAMAVVTDLVPIVLDGRVEARLVQAMREAKNLKEAAAAAHAAADAARAARAAYAARAARAAADAAARAARAAYAAYAARAARAAYAAAAYAAPKHDFWAHAIRILEGAIELDGTIKPAQWQASRLREALP